MAKIIYHHWKDEIKEKDDEALGWWTIPPELILTEKEEAKLNKWWKRFGGTYIVDPLGWTQCNYIMYKELPWWFRWLIVKPTKEHVYDIEKEN